MWPEHFAKPRVDDDGHTGIHFLLLRLTKQQLQTLVRVEQPHVLLISFLQCCNLRLFLLPLLSLFIRLPNVNCWIIENDSMILHGIMERTRDDISERANTKRGIGWNSSDDLPVLVLHHWYRVPACAEHLLERLWLVHGVGRDIVCELRVYAVAIRLSPLRLLSTRVRIRVVSIRLSLFI